MREDNAEKSAREGLVDYARAETSTVARTKACGCPLAGCTVECRRQQVTARSYDELMQAVATDNL